MAKIFAGNLDFGTTETEISDLFQRFGEVSEVEFIRDGRGLFRGFAFVRMGDEAARAAVSALEGTWFNGRKIVARLNDSQSGRREKGRIRLVAQDGSYARIVMANGNDAFMAAGQWRGSETDTSLTGRAVEFEVSRGNRGFIARDVWPIDGAGEGPP